MSTNLMEHQKELKELIVNKLESCGKAGLELFTSGGKSFIGMSLIEDFVSRSNKDVLWIAPKSALMNVKTRYIDKQKYANRVKFCTISMLSRYHNILDTQAEYDNIGLIIIDEAHKLMACNAYDCYKSELGMFSDVMIFAMTASSFRNLDGIRSLERLVGESNILRYNLGEAIDESIANPVRYFGTSMSYNKGCYTALDKISKMYGHVPYIMNIIDKAREELNKQHVTREDKVVNFIQDKVKFDCSCGDRHIVFFSRIAELKENIGFIKSVMEKLYDNANINIIEYHGELSDAQALESIHKINSAPVQNNVDVILTVDKGVESIHPENMRSEIIFRSTKSMVKFTQMVGRVITLSDSYKQNNYVFDFCDSVRFLGADSIIIGHRRLNERVEYDTENSLTPEALLQDIISIKNTSNSKKSIEVNVDESMQSLDDIFFKLAIMYDVLKNVDKFEKLIWKNISIINKDYNSNIAKFIMHTQPDEIFKEYKLLQNALLYKGLTEEDRHNISRLESLYGYKMYLTESMSDNEEATVRSLYRYMSMYRTTGYSEENMSAYAYKEIRSIACKLLTDALDTSIEAFIKQDEKLYKAMIGMFETIAPRQLGCMTKDKSRVVADTIESIKSTPIEKVSREVWLEWKASIAYVKHVFKRNEFVENEKKYAIASLKYISTLQDGVYSKKYSLNDREKCLGTKVIRILNNYFREKENNISSIDESFLYSLLEGKYDEDTYILNIFDLAGYTDRFKVKKNLMKKTRTYGMYEAFIQDKNEENLINLMKINKEMSVPSTVNDEMMSSVAVKKVLKEAGSSGNTTLVKYCINKLSNNDKLMQYTVKRAALNGLGYDGIIALAFPVEAYNNVINVLNESRSGSKVHDKLKKLKNMYCVMPYATSAILRDIRDSVIPSKGYNTEKEFIRVMVQ